MNYCLDCRLPACYIYVSSVCNEGTDFSYELCDVESNGTINSTKGGMYNGRVDFKR